jgi:hypothetical protein
MIKNFTIIEDIWLQGENGLKTKLYRESDKKLDCFGFFALACGLTRNDIKNKESLAAVDPQRLREVELNPEFLLFDTSVENKFILKNSEAALKIMRVNDAPLEKEWSDGTVIMTEDQRKEMLKSAFQQVGVEINFE